jgi:hypothetical protein
VNKVFFDPRIELSMPNNSNYHILKVLLVSPLLINGCQSWTFSVQVIEGPIDLGVHDLTGFFFLV